MILKPYDIYNVLDALDPSYDTIILLKALYGDRKVYFSDKVRAYVGIYLLHIDMLFLKTA